MRRCVDADTNSLTQRLAGTFTPTEDLYREAGRARGLMTALFDRTQAAGAIREDLVVNDVGLLLEQVAALRVGDPPLPGPPSSWEEVAARWNP